MFSKSLIQFSVDGWSCVPSLLFTLGQTMVKIMKIMVTSFKRSHACTAALSAPTLCRPLPTYASSRDSWTLMGKSGSASCWVTTPFSWVLVHKVLFVPSKSLFPQSCVSSGGSMVGLMATSSKRAYAIPRSVCCTQSPCPCGRPLLTCSSTADTQTQFTRFV